MTTTIRGAAALRLATLGLLAVGCATGGSPADIAQRELEARNRELASLRTEVEQREVKIQSLSRQLDELPKVSAPPPRGGGDLLPPGAKPGECFARVFVPPSYTSATERVLARQASTKIEVLPARYESGTERVLIREASQRLEVVPATYGTVEERVLVKPASFRLEEVPAVHGWEEEKILVKPAQTVWKKGRGPIEKVDHATGEIMCLVEEPAEYKVVKKRVLEQEATTRRVEIPAVYETVKKRVMKTPPSTRTVEIPAEYKTVKVRKLVAPASERRVEIPAEYQTVTRRVTASEGELAWRPVLCETNITPGTVTAMQRALRDAGHSPGPIDGRVGQQTLGAVRSYQQKKGLATGGITLATLDSLGVRAR